MLLQHTVLLHNFHLSRKGFQYNDPSGQKWKEKYMAKLIQPRQLKFMDLILPSFTWTRFYQLLAQTRYFHIFSVLVTFLAGFAKINIFLRVFKSGLDLTRQL